jgi:hypothetical protein
MGNFLTVYLLGGKIIYLGSKYNGEKIQRILNHQGKIGELV